VGTKREIIAKYNYIDEDYKMLFQVIRYHPKSFAQRAFDMETRNWVYSLKGVRRVLYNLPRVICADVIFVVEGEKDADNLHDFLKKGSSVNRIAVTTCSGGSSAWKEEYNKFFKDKIVYIIPDTDKAGHLLSIKVAKGIIPYAYFIKIVNVFHSGESYIKQEFQNDISDWIDKGHSLNEFIYLCQTSEKVTDEYIKKEEEKFIPVKFKRYEKLKWNYKEFPLTTEHLVTKEMIMRALDYPVSRLIEVNRNGKAHCINPSHEDVNWSMDTRNNFCYCYGCGYHGDSISVARFKWKCDFKTAVRKLCKLLVGSNEATEDEGRWENNI
jgi:DNA primase